MSKLKKEELEQDILIEYSSRFMHFYENNKAAVIGGGIGLLLAIGLSIAYVIYTGNQEVEATNLLGIAEQELLQGNFQEALYGNEEEFTLGFVQIAENYSGTDAGNLAHYYAAISEFELGNYEESLTYIQEYDLPEGILGVAPISMHANILVELERFDEAAVQFEKAATWDENSSTTPYNLFKAAEAHREAGNYDQALTHIETVINDYPNSQQLAQAEKLKGLITQSTPAG
ncbi:MAG: tetratricopeptide repeat protein [Balneolaceae bacterium]|nr:tetratricopeptide repeat protein [Balneolaceae bacterium]